MEGSSNNRLGVFGDRDGTKAAWFGEGSEEAVGIGKKLTIPIRDKQKNNAK